ncbi:2-dehydro-3-deoxygalactonokinase [Vannielia litorea]|uniref:2-keto-3-deoxygalactonate kinase n=1 Tax=Vannielia litorea TaxID=1217970 RepID=A0A1N6E057_9RHOB|nr:2-dehydro-3-deoxygalactonokinase [Vannielia litorea]SIN76410.1 2-keto-3-deoxygalactonate kinase [Vannielia litorea]
MTPGFAAVDWGTTSFRLWLIDETGAVRGRRSAPTGMGQLGAGEYAPLLEDHLDSLGADPSLPVVIAGMAGARGGWVEAPYADITHGVAGLAASAVRVPHPRRDLRILPGLKQLEPANVMRGEETQIAGFLVDAPEHTGVLCLPGTHTKWVLVEEGRLLRFATAMTGELFALLAKTSVLRHSVGEDGLDDYTFRAAVREAADAPGGPMLPLFGVRANALLHDAGPAEGRSRLSGLLIGAELAATRAYWSGRPVDIIGAPELARNYQIALAVMGTAARQHDAEKLTLAGLKSAFAKMNRRET